MRRNKASSLKPKTVLTSIVICAALCLAGIGYVWAKNEVLGLGRDQKKLEVRLEELKRRNDVLQRTYAAMCSPAKLDARVKELNLGLASPLPSQIVRFPSEPVRTVQQSPETHFYAATNNEN